MTALVDKFANQLDWNLLRTFMVIVQERSITLAAHRLSVTQPSVSAALRRLEEQLDRRLIERGGAASFQPTAAGEVLYRHCADIYRLVTALPDALDAAHSAVQGIVTLHLSGHVHWPELPALIAAYRQEYPLVRFRIKRGTCGDILSLLAQKNAALGVVSAPDARPTLSRAPLFEQDMLHYAAAGAPSGELRGAPVIGYEDEQTGAPLAALAVHRIRCGLEGATVAEGLDCDAVAALVRAGAGIRRPPAPLRRGRSRPGGVAAGTRDAAGLPGAPRTGRRQPRGPELPAIPGVASAGRQHAPPPPRTEPPRAGQAHAPLRLSLRVAGRPRLPDGRRGSAHPCRRDPCRSQTLLSAHLTDTVAKRLLAEIQEGRAQPGDKLPTETALAERFGVSRTVIREAVSRLRQDGIVEARQGSGVFVTGATGNRALRIDAAELRSLDAVLHIVELRRALETEIAAQAAARASKRDMAAIDAALAAISRPWPPAAMASRKTWPFTAASRTPGNPYFLTTLTFVQPVPGRRHPHHTRQRGAPTRCAPCCRNTPPSSRPYAARTWKARAKRPACTWSTPPSD